MEGEIEREKGSWEADGECWTLSLIAFLEIWARRGFLSAKQLQALCRRTSAVRFIVPGSAASTHCQT